MSAALLDLGRREYGQVWELQKRLVAARAADRVQDTLILVEHEPVVTLGRRTSPGNFKPQDIPVFQVERGGGGTPRCPRQVGWWPDHHHPGCGPRPRPRAHAGEWVLHRP